MKYADLILPLAMPKPLTYGIPVQWQGLLQPGTRVEVQMGKNKLYAAIVLRIHDEQPESFSIKPIKNIIDREPLVSQQQLALWQWVAAYYMCSLGEVMQAALPAHFKLMNESVLVWSEHFRDIPAGLSDDAFTIAETLYYKRTLTLEEMRNILNHANVAQVLDELLIREVVSIHESLEERYQPKVEKRVSLTPDFSGEEEQSKLVNGMSRSPKQLALFFAYIEMYKKAGYVSVPDLLKKSSATHSQLHALIEKGVFRIDEATVDRLNTPGNREPEEVILNTDQSQAVDQIYRSWQEKEVVLLHGVTGSGKTLVYIRLIQDAIKNHGQVLLLLPEIALTTHIVSRLASYFGAELGVYHSRFSDNERVEIWNKVKNKTYSVIVGPRSAIWLPFRDLSMIIVDEEHEVSYKQSEPAPRFQARDTAVMYATSVGAKVLLGSATPSVESYHNARQNKYGLVTLSKRYGDVALPVVQIVPARHYIPALSHILTKPLLDEVAATIQQGKQVILFQNKRGYAPFLICTGCGWVAKCRQCDVSLTYHKHSDKMHCHYCGTKYPRVNQCEQCGLPKVSARSFGTERVEEELSKIFRQVKIGRLDWDVAKGKNAYNRILQEFESGKIQILVGTQMVVKGLDFERVGLVGVLNSDSLLSYPDYRVNERGFQLLEQVAGRAGRKDETGKVIIQAYNVHHHVLMDVCRHDYPSFFRKEMEDRQMTHYPPFTRFIKIAVRHRKESVAEQGAVQFVQMLQEVPHIIINGPAPALISKIRNHYIYEIWIKAGKNNQALAGLKTRILQLIRDTRNIRGFSTLYFVCDADP